MTNGSYAFITGKSQILNLSISIEGSMTRVCNNCGVSNILLKNCSNCKKVCYCSKRCQKTDWKSRHKDACTLLVQGEEAQQLPTSQSNQLFIDKKKQKNLGLKECLNCGGHEFPLSNCSRCKISSYCGKACQLQHWNDGHESFCIPFHQRFQKGFVEPENDRGVLCMICQDSLTSRTEMILSCSHVFHIACIADLLRYTELAKTCPTCRTSLNDLQSAFVSLMENKVKKIYEHTQEQGYKEKNLTVYMQFNELQWNGQELTQKKLSFENFCEDYPFLKIEDSDFFFMSGVHSFLRGEIKEATIFLLKQLKQNKSDFMCKKFLAILYEIIRYSA